MAVTERIYSWVRDVVAASSTGKRNFVERERRVIVWRRLMKLQVILCSLKCNSHIRIFLFPPFRP